MSGARRQAQQQGRAQIKQRIHGQCPQCTLRSTPRPVSLLFWDKQRTRLPEHWLILLKSQELQELSVVLFFLTLFIFFLSFFWQRHQCQWVPSFHASLAHCFIHFISAASYHPLVFFKSSASACWSPTCLH